MNTHPILTDDAYAKRLSNMEGSPYGDAFFRYRAAIRHSAAGPNDQLLGLTTISDSDLDEFRSCAAMDANTPAWELCQSLHAWMKALDGEAARRVEAAWEVVRNEETGEVYTAGQVAGMRFELEQDTGLNLSDMSPKGVIANYLARKQRS